MGFLGAAGIPAYLRSLHTRARITSALDLAGDGDGCGGLAGMAGAHAGVRRSAIYPLLRVRQPNLPYRVVCYTAAWVDILVPYALNVAGLMVASITGVWKLKDMYTYGYYPLAVAVVIGTALNLTPRAKRDTFGEGAERAWFYIAIWTVVPTQVVNWAAWRMGKYVDLAPLPLARTRLAVCLVAMLFFFLLGYASKLPRTQRYYSGVAAAGV